jgi:hypothetical protein
LRVIVPVGEIGTGGVNIKLLDEGVDLGCVLAQAASHLGSSCPRGGIKFLSVHGADAARLFLADNFFSAPSAERLP